MHSNFNLDGFRGRRVVKIVSILLLQTFLFYNVGFAMPGGALPEPSKQIESREISIENIGVSKDIGSVKTKYKGKNGKLIIHIQDAHCNYEAQTNISKILENFSKGYDINLVSVEGADGYIDTSWFKAFPDAEIRKEVADYFMKKGEITGAEFLSITTDYPIKLYGAENRDLYIKNLNAFTTTYPYKEEIEKHLSDIKTVLNRLKGYIYTKALKDFDDQIEKYKTKDLTLSEYAKILKENIKEHKLNINDYPDYAKLVYTLVYEDKIDFKTVDQERATLIDTLSRALTKEKLQDLVTKSFSFRVGKVTAAEYYTYLKELSVENGIDLTKEYPNLANYVIYTRLYERIDNERLFEELDVIKNTIKERLFKNDDQRKLSASWDNVNILLGLINIKLSNKEYDYYKAHKDEVKPEFFINFIRSKVGMYNLSYKFDDPSETLIEHLSELEKFYEIAAKRDRALVDNTIKTMGDEKKDTAILITGGFHTEGIKHALEEKGYSYIVVCPNITKDVESPYIQVLTNQKTPFEELLVESAAPAREDNLLGPFVLAKLTHLSKKELRDLDRRIARVKKRYAARQVGSLEERIDNVTGNWVRKYVSLYIDKVRKEGYTPEKDSDLLENVFLLAYKDRVREVFEQPQRGSYEDETGEAESLIREEFARLRSGTAGRGPMRMAKENALLTEEEALAVNHPIRQVIEQAQEAETKGKKEDAAKLWNKILVGDNMYFDVLDDLALDRAIVEYNWNPDNPVRVPLDLECHPGTRDTKGVYYETGDFSKVEVHAYLRRSVYNVLTPAERETLVRHERMHIRIALRNAMVPDSFEGTEEDYVNLQEGCDVRPILKKIKNMRQMNFCQNAEKLIGESLESRPPNPDLLALAIAFGIEARIGFEDKTALPRLLNHIYGWRGYKKQLVDNTVKEAFKILNRKYPLLVKKWLPEALQGQEIILPARAFFEKNLPMWLKPREVSPKEVQAVIMAGGGGTRLWPLSTSGTPKQLLSLIGGKPLIEIAVIRLMRSGMPARNIYIQTNPAFKERIFELVKEHGIKKSQIFAEPQMADTAAAIGYAVTKFIEMEKGDIPTFFVTADHIIGAEIKSTGITFIECYLKAAAACKESPLIGTIGINPLVWGRPSSDFGHIKVGDETFVKDIYTLEKFIEKPSPADAQNLFDESERIFSQGQHVGAYLFNSGMFIATPEVFLRAFQRLSPAYYDGFKRIMDATAPEKGAVEEQVFSEFAEWKEQKTFPHPTKKPKGVSFDFAVAEPLGDDETPDVGILVIPGGFPWTDIGSFRAIFEHCQEHRESDFDDRGNLVLAPEGVTIKGQDTCKNCLIFVSNEIPEEEKSVKITLDLNGLKDSIVIYNPKTKACLIAPMDVKGEDIRYISNVVAVKGERWAHYLTGEVGHVPERTTIFRAETLVDTRLFSTHTGRVISKNTNESRLYSDYGLLTVIDMSNLCVLQHKHTQTDEVDITIDFGKDKWRENTKDRANALKSLHVNRVRSLTSSQRVQTLLEETPPLVLTPQTYANMFGLDIEGDYKAITEEINEIKRTIKARRKAQKDRVETTSEEKKPDEKRPGTTGRGAMRTGRVEHEGITAKPDIGEIIKAIKINEIEEAVTNFFAYAQKLELPTTGLGLISNELIEYYGGLKRAQSDILEQTRSNIENFLKAVISEAVHEKNVDTARGLEIMSTQVLNIISWIDRGVSGAEGMRVTSNIKDMVQAEDKERGPSYIDKATLPVKPTGIEGTPGFYYRGAERPDTKYNLDELKDTAFADYREESERTVMYAMDHGFIEVPSSLMEMTKKGQISAMHETTFINGMMPNSARYTDTGKGHWQGKYLDIKQVTKGRVLQLIDIYDAYGKHETLVHVVNEGEVTRAIPGSVDYMIPLTDVVMFNDIRVEVPGDLISEFNPHIKDALDLELIEEAVSKKEQAGYKLIDFKGKPVLVKVDAAGPDVTSWITYPEQAKLKNLISFYRGTTPGEIENLIKDLAVARPHYLKEAPMHVMDLQEKSELPEYLRALGELNSIIKEGKPIKFVLEFRTGREGYVWGEPVRVSSILELLGAKTESEKIRLAGELGIPENTVISERWITAGAIELGPGYMRLPLEVLALWGKDVFGIQHLAQFGSETGINAKQLTSARPLSLQIHTFPEMFIPLEDGYAYLGLSRDVTKEEFIEALRKGDESILNRTEVKKGQPVIVPAGMPHAYGTVRIYEVKAVTAAQDKAGTRSIYDRLRLSESQKQEVAGIQREYRVVQEAASLLVAKELVREGKDVLTLASEEVEKTVDIIERHGYLNRVDLAETEFMPILVSNVKTEDRARFEIIGFTEAFVVGRYTINPGQSIESNELTHGKPHSIFVTEGKVEIFDEKGQTIDVITKGEERMIPSNIGRYRLATFGSERVVVYTQFKPLGNEPLIINAYVPSKETLTGIISGKSIFEDRHKIILTEKGATVERIEIKTGEFILKQSPGKTRAVLTLEVGDRLEVTDESGIKLAQLEKGKPVSVPSSGNLIFKSKGAAVVKIMYPETKEEKAVFTTVEVLRRNLEMIRQRLGVGEAATAEKPKGIQILQSNDLAGNLYCGGDKNTEGHIRNEEERLSRYLGVKVKITRRDTWEQLLKAVDTENYIPVVMSTDKEMRSLLSRGDAEEILPELSRLRILPPMDSSILSSLNPGEGWLYTRELEGLAILLAAINPEDITENTQIAQDFLLIVNSMVDEARRITDISRLSLMLPGQKEAVEDIRARFNDLINAILLTMPARPFDKDNDIYRKREVLYSV